MDPLRSRRGRGAVSRTQSDRAEPETPRTRVSSSRGLRWRGRAGIYGTTPWIVTCQLPPSCTGMGKKALDRYARVAYTYTPTHIDTVKRPRFSPIRVVVPLGFLVVSHSKSRLRDRSMSSLLCRALIEARGLRFIQSSKYQGTDMLKNRARINRQK